MNIIMHLVIIIYILFILNIYIIIEIYNYEIRKIQRKLYTESVSFSNREFELVSIINRESESVSFSNHETEHDNIYGCINTAQNNFIKNTNNFNSILLSLKDELVTCNILYNNTLMNNRQYDSYTKIQDNSLSKCNEEYFDYYIYNIYSGEICNEFNIMDKDYCSEFNIITLMLGLERCNI